MREFALVIRREGGELLPIETGQVSDYGLWKLIWAVSAFRQIMPELNLLVEDNLVCQVRFTRNGAQLRGKPVEVGS